MQEVEYGNPKPETLSGDENARPKHYNQDFFRKVKKRFQSAYDAARENHNTYVEDVKFSAADDQWEEGTKEARGAGRPALTFNRLNAVIKQIIGDYRQNKMSIKVRPASGEASDTVADIQAGIIRNIEAQSSADVAYTNALDCAARGGFGYYRIIPTYSSDDMFEQDLSIVPIHNPLTVLCDPSAKMVTREDANFYFITETVKKEDFEDKYHEAKMIDFDPSADDSEKLWCNEEDGIRVAEYFEKDRYKARLAKLASGITVEIQNNEEAAALAFAGQQIVAEREVMRTRIIWRKMTAMEVLEERVMPIRFIPIIPVLGEEVNVEGRVLTRSAIFYAKDAQRTYNYNRSVATEMVALSPKAPWLVTPQQIEKFQALWDKANVAPLPYLVYNHIPDQPMPQRLSPAVTPSAELTMALGAADDIKATTGIYDASLGARGNETSGRAIIARQQEGDTSTFLFIDNLRKSIEFCGRILIEWIPHIYDTERVVRLLDGEGNTKTEIINKEVPDVLTGITQVLNSVSIGKYDVVIEAGPSFASRKAEALSNMTQLVQAVPDVFGVAGDLIVKSMDFPGAEDIAERIKRSMPPQLTENADETAQPQQPVIPPEAIAQLQQQIQGLAKENEKLKQQVDNKQAEFELKAGELQLKAQDLAIKDKEATGKLMIEERRLETEAYTRMIPTQPEMPEPKEAPEPPAPPINITVPVHIDGKGAVVKQSRAVKQPDGSWLMVSEEAPVALPTI